MSDIKKVVSKEYIDEVKKYMIDGVDEHTLETFINDGS